jgi:hypothetical protein
MRSRRKDEWHGLANIDLRPDGNSLRQDRALCLWVRARPEHLLVHAETEARKDVNRRTKREPCDVRNAHGCNLSRRWRLSPWLGTFTEAETTQHESAAQ